VRCPRTLLAIGEDETWKEMGCAALLRNVYRDVIADETTIGAMAEQEWYAPDAPQHGCEAKNASTRTRPDLTERVNGNRRSSQRSEFP
jgi:hypothetical protein